MDRDGTLIVDVGYCSHAEQVHLLPGVKENLQRLKARGLKLVIITNQSGIGRGYFAEADFWTVQKKLEEKIGPGVIDATYFCPDWPGEFSGRRKPAPGMLLEAAHDLDIDLRRSFMVGDQCSDVEAGIRAGVKASILIYSRFEGKVKPGPTGSASVEVSRVQDAAKHVLTNLESCSAQSGAALVAADFAETTNFILENL